MFSPTYSTNTTKFPTDYITNKNKLIPNTLRSPLPTKPMQDIPHHNFLKEINPAIMNLLIQRNNQSNLNYIGTYFLPIVSKENIALGLLSKPNHGIMIKLQIKDYNIYQSQKEFHLEEIECVPWISDTLV